MVTGASNANLIVILIDARNGIVEQTRRHSIIASLLNIPHVIVAINKMDLVDYSRDRYNDIVIDYAEIARTLQLKDVVYLPVSALKGDNIVGRSANLPWYEGPTLLELLEKTELQKDIDHTRGRMSVQYVIRPQTEEFHDYRGYAGKITSGTWRKGDLITVLPSGLTSRIREISSGGREVGTAFAQQSVILQLEDDIDISRGDLLVNGERPPKLAQEFEALVCWMDTKPLGAGNKYLLQLGSRTVRGLVRDIEYRLDVNTLERQPSPGHAGLNDIVKLTFRTAAPLPFDAYTDLPANGGAILIDETSHVTVGACLLQTT
jgi:sulfate adenylyltransferase subunit 1